MREEHPFLNVSLTGGPVVILRQQMRSKSERTGDVLAALAASIPDARATQGVISLDIARDILDPDSFVATGIYEDAAALAEQAEAVRLEIGGAVQNWSAHRQPAGTTK